VETDRIGTAAERLPPPVLPGIRSAATMAAAKLFTTSPWPTLPAFMNHGMTIGTHDRQVT